MDQNTLFNADRLAETTTKLDESVAADVLEEVGLAGNTLEWKADLLYF